MTLPVYTWRLPDWIAEVAPPGDTFSSREARMRLVVRLSRENFARGSGGPFGAAVFEAAGGRLIAPGVNQVVASRCSAAHAEMLALVLAQQALGSHDLGGAGAPAYELVSSAEPCAMCLGAVSWSGVRRLVCGARDADARAIGFDEGPKPPDWVAAFEARGIEVVRDVCRDEARAVLEAYREAEGQIYNPGRRGDG